MWCGRQRRCLFHNGIYRKKIKNQVKTSGHGTTFSTLLVRKANAKGRVSGFEIAPPNKGGGSDKHLAVD